MRASGGLRLSQVGALALSMALVACVVAATSPRARADVAVGPNAPIAFRLFPADNPWNQDVSTLPVSPNSAAYIASIGSDIGLHPDFGTVWDGAPNGIPYVLVHGDQPKVPITFYYGDESDPGPYPIPPDAPIEGGPNSDGDRHVLTLDVDNRILYEVFDAHYDAATGSWSAGSGAVWYLDSDALRPDGWTSADAAGLPILPGLVRYDEVASGEITHALRFTVPRTQRAYIYPATHYASDSTDPSLPPMGLRLRLKAAVDISGFPAEDQVILRALKRYGMIVADNGSAFYISGAPDQRWDDDALHLLGDVKGSDFEVVDTTGTASLPSPPPAAAPRLALGGSASARVRHTFKRWGRFSDASGSAWSATVTFGDRSGAKRLALTATKRFELRHTYHRRGTFTVTVRVRSDRDRVGVARLRVRVHR